MIKRLGIGLSLTAVLFVGFVAGRVTADQPHMQNALRYLDSAKDELELADPNKGGHRDEAIDLIRQARDQVRQGMGYAR